MGPVVISNKLGNLISSKEQKGFPFRPTNAFYKEIGVHKRKFGQYVRNEKQPTLDELAAISTAFGVDPVELLQIKSPATAGNSAGQSVNV